MTPAPSASEIVTLLLIAMMVPLTLRTVRHFRHQPQPFFVAGLLIMAVASILAVTEHVFMSYFSRDAKNILFAVGAVTFAIAMVRQNLAVRSGRL